MKVLLNRMPVLRPEYARIDYRQKGPLRKRSHGRNRSHIASAPLLHAAVTGPGKTRQRGVDALVGEAGPPPAGDVTPRHPQHHKPHHPPAPPTPTTQSPHPPPHTPPH